jgi:thiol-disulfide isomerase/thioredoxin
MSDPTASASQVTNPTTTSGSAPSGTGGRLWLALPLVIVLALAAVFVFSEYRKKPELTGGVAPGELFPEIEAAGWINGGPPSKSDLAGHIVVVDVWASWCPQCAWLAAKLAEMEKKYEGKGVIFIGLTSDRKDSLPEIEAFIEKAGMKFPNGYGALKTVQQTRCEALPAMWVVGPDGRVLWNGDRGREKETADSVIDRELARMAGKS